jgi:outer membrane protein
MDRSALLSPAYGYNDDTAHRSFKGVGMTRFNPNLVMATLAAVSLAAVLSSVLAAEDSSKDIGSRLGVVNTEKLLTESNLGKAMESTIRAEFSPRETDLRNDAKKLQAAAAKLDKDAASLPDADKLRKQRELADLDRELQRKQREFRESMDSRVREERSKIAQKANQALKLVAEQRRLDVILQEAAYANPRVDVTDEVIKALNNLR